MTEDSRLEVSEADIIAVQRQTHAYREVISSIDTELQQLTQRIGRLRARKEHYLDLIAKCRGAISLARRAPDEVLALIFEFCVASGWARAPVVVSQVCFKWRRAALSPRVWSYVYLTTDSLDPIGRTSLWLSRARESPLHVTVDVHSIDSSLLVAFNLLLNRVHQWRTFSIDARLVQHANTFLALCRHSAPQLRLLHISTSEINSDIEPQPADLNGLRGLHEAFLDSPDLHSLHLSLNGFPLSLTTHVASIWLEMSHTSTELLEVASILGLLQALPALHTLTLVVPSDLANAVTLPDVRSPPYTLAHLESLTLNGYPAFNGILRCIHSPALRRLHIRSTDQPLNYPHEPTGSALCQFLQHSSPPIELLELHDIDIRRDDFVAGFSHLANLRELRLHETEVPNEVFDALQGPSGLCPLLTRLDLRWCEQLSGRTLVDLVRSREGGGGSSSIEFVTVINCALVEEAAVLELAQMTVCSVMIRDISDHCRPKGCCDNARYRLRLKLRLADLLRNRDTRLLLDH
ncbi:hypothetical protein FA95DRAFT_1537909 [Auriscalpium vulgare]|uniref:Uncharacterized protein n=1 Tax=Auriscalpium vulgare TaxID=40419 RepID=A0ACB8RZL9_9AGAM|nr:hypothetical protein FA95DRAFT_1537909 [Auriscalpium vulgare]